MTNFCRPALFVLAVIFACASAHSSDAGEVTGAIFTSDQTGARVNGNIYTQKSAVYLNGGPANNTNLVDGSYFFQVTDPSGEVLLSTDNIAERRILVKNGIFNHYEGSTHTVSTLSNTQIMVALAQFADSSNSGGEYKVWLTPVSAYKAGEGNFGFINSDSKTDNFKIKAAQAVPPVLSNVPAEIRLEQAGPGGTFYTIPTPPVYDPSDSSPMVTSNAPALFPPGTSIVTFTVTNSSGLSCTATTQVIVSDTISPTISNVSPIVVEQADLAGTRVNVALPIATDACTTNVLVKSDAPAVFPLGTTRVNFTATDAAGNTSTTSTTITVKDTLAPIICDVIVVEQSCLAGTKVNLPTLQAVDVCDAAPLVTCNAPAIFPLGKTMVKFTISDASGNTAHRFTQVHVIDTTPPVLSNVPAPITVEATSPQGTVLKLVPPLAKDICDAAPVVTSNAPGIFPFGKTIVTFTATDASGNVAKASTVVTVSDTTPPKILNLAATMTFEQNCYDGAAVTMPMPEVFDNLDLLPVLTCNAPAILPPGKSVVTYTARDKSGNTCRATVNVTVVDTKAPVISGLPAKITYPAESLPKPTVTDIADRNPTMTNDAPASFPVGTTLVTYTARDAAGNIAKAKLEVLCPLAFFNVPAPITLEQATPSGTVYKLPYPIVVSATGEKPAMTCDAPGIFPPGKTIVTFCVKDSRGNFLMTSTSVTVRDSIAPIFQTIFANMTVDAKSPAGTSVVLPVAKAWDACDPMPVITCDAPKLFPIGSTRVTYTARDRAGNKCDASFIVKVVDCTPPQIVFLSAIPVLPVYDTRGMMVPVTLSTNATDNGTKGVTVKIRSVTCSDLKAKVETDWKITGDQSVSLRVSATRTYTVTLNCTDAAGNIGSKIVYLRVYPIGAIGCGCDAIAGK
jgi:large repetitive protein